MNNRFKFMVVITIAAVILLAVGCSQSKSPVATSSNQGEAKPNSIVPVSLNTSALYRAELTAETGEVRAGAPSTLIFTVKDAKGATIRNLQVVHEKPMHLLVVSNDLAEFDHIHPQPQADGTYKVTYTFSGGGSYRLYADYTPEGAKQVVDRFDVTVSGAERVAEALVADTQYTKTVDGLTVTMFPDKPLRAGQELMLNFAVADAQTGAPVKDLEKYLGALAHFVVISEDMSEFLHIHPMEPGEMKGQPMVMETRAEQNATERTPAVSAHTTFPRAGLFKLWAQFQRGGRVITVPFVVRVAGGDETAEAGKGAAAVPSDAVKVTVSKDGFEPSQITVKKGQPVKIAFYRADAQNCAGEVVFPSLKVKKALPVGQTTVIEIKPRATGDLAFSCGMGMFSGKLVVTN